MGISVLTDNIHKSVVMPGETTGCLSPPSRLLHELQESPEAFPLSASSYEDDISTVLANLLSRSGFTTAQTRELQLHHIRWPLMDEEEFQRRLNSSQDNREE
ncbi:cytoplasmic protein [Salmonella enterica]|nr:cytoplasmic protein [Salmonella enterica]EDW7804603.1 cytoplasmic protein [Salmonella enterica]